MTPTRLFVAQIARAREAFGFKEDELCKLAGIKSRSQISRSRSTGSPMSWDAVAALVVVLSREYGVSRDWLLWGEGKMVPGSKLLRVGEGSDSVHPRPIVPSKPPSEPLSAGDDAPRAGKNRRRP